MNGSAIGAATVPVRRVVTLSLAIFSTVTAVIHLLVADEHFRQYWVFGLFMVAAAALQVAWATAATVRPSRGVLWFGAALDAGIVAVYLVTRTVGDVVGPTPDAVEPVGFADGVCTGLEIVILVGCLWLLLADPIRRVGRRVQTLTSAATGGCAVVLLAAVLVTGTSETMTSANGATMPGSSAMAMAGSTGTTIRLATTSPAGDITLPDVNLQMAAGMAMASSTACTARPTASQQAAAVSLVDASWKAAAKYRSLTAARAAGYRPITPTGAAVVHYLNPAFYRAARRGGPALDTSAPQSLVYANTPRGAVLAAVMYISNRRDGTPQPGGCLTQWHVHTNLCLARGVGVVAEEDPTCPPGSVNRVTAPMMHVWFVPIPGGPMAIDATDAQVVGAAEHVPSPANGQA